jgi:hydrogenase maturation protease
MKIAPKKTAKTLVLGLGNELRGDDAVGLLVVRELRRRLVEKDDLVFLEASVGGLALLDLVRGYQNLIVVDAIRTEGGKAGDIYRLTGDDLSASQSSWSAHQMGLRTVLDTGRACGCSLPGNIVIYAVEVADVHRWRRGCSQEVQDAVGRVADRILEEQLAALQSEAAVHPEAAIRTEVAARHEATIRPGAKDQVGGAN